MRIRGKALAGAAAVFWLGFGAAGAQDTEPQARMAPQLVAAASAFETYLRTAAAIDPAFGDGKAVALAVQVGAAHHAEQIETGMIAYGALAALQEPRFVAGVRRAADEAGSPEALARKLVERPDLVTEIDGADPAAARAAQAIAGAAVPLVDEGRRVKQAAYDVQHQAWSKVFVPDPAGVLARAKDLSKADFAPGDEDTNRLYQAITRRVDAGEGAGRPTETVSKSLALAAEALLGRAGEADLAQLTPLLSEARSASCLHMAKLNLFQCLAVAGPHYEDIFCLGVHGMTDPGQCVAQAAGTPSAQRSPVPAPTIAANDLSVPVARLESRAP